MDLSKLSDHPAGETFETDLLIIGGGIPIHWGPR